MYMCMYVCVYMCVVSCRAVRGHERFVRGVQRLDGRSVPMRVCCTGVRWVWDGGVCVCDRDIDLVVEVQISEYTSMSA